MSTSFATVGVVAGGYVISDRGDGSVAIARVDPTAGPTAGPIAAATPGSGPAPTDQRVLVVVQMGGGNDGLNTLIPIDAGTYHDARPSIAIGDADAIRLAGLDGVALHPAMAPMASMWERGDLAAVQSLALPGQSRSHFVALDSWWRGSASPSTTTGWLGRWLDSTVDPAEPVNPMRAVSLGGGSPAVTGATTRPVIVQTLGAFDLLGPTDSGAARDAFAAMAPEATTASDSALLAQARSAIPITTTAVSELQTAFGLSAEPVEPALGEYATAELFQAAADIVAADLGTRVIVINMGGFDTHANQLVTQQRLLGEFAAGIETMYSSLKTRGIDDRVLTMTFSEFGRRVAENGSGGTDHGLGGLAFLAGPAVSSPQVIGDLDLVNLVDGDVPSTIDTRSLYANALGWLGGPTDEILGGAFDTYGLITA